MLYARRSMVLFCCSVLVGVSCAPGQRERAKPGTTDRPPSRTEQEDQVISDLIRCSEKKLGLGHYKDFRDLTLSKRQLESAVTYVSQNRDYKSFHLLIAIKNTSAELYYEGIPVQDKAMILTSALRSQHYFNDWSVLLPDIKGSDGPAGEAVLELGKAAIPYLTPILADSSPAHWSGSDSSATSAFYQFRRKDFAFRYISLILGRSPTFLADPSERDKAINALNTN